LIIECGVLVAMLKGILGTVFENSSSLIRGIVNRREADPVENLPHYVLDYRKHVRNLIANHPIDEAMSLAVGGHYDEIGQIAAEIVIQCGATNSSSIIDLGCGSGRLAKQIGIRLPQIQYLGIDVVQELLDYAATRTPPHFRYLLNYAQNIPVPDASVDMVVAFSVFTHLYHEESFVYLRDIKRVLRPGGAAVFSFLETATHWPVFEHLVAGAGRPRASELTMFMERPQIESWADHLGFRVQEYNPGPYLGQTVAMLTRP
jgi:ubiquinone/menaquinone biosynthesis C-methylase UbiE